MGSSTQQEWAERKNATRGGVNYAHPGLTLILLSLKALETNVSILLKMYMMIYMYMMI
jgi:hypothetical protein